MKFNRTKFVGLDNKPKYRFKPEPEQEFHIDATSAGVELKGTLVIDDYNNLDPFAKAFGRAWEDHTKLRNDLRKSLMANMAGH